MIFRVAVSDQFSPTLPPRHRFPMAKYGLVREQLLYEGTLEPHHFVTAAACPPDDILRVHTPAYWHHLRDLTLPPKAVRRMGFPLTPQLLERSRRSVGGTLAATGWALTYGIGLNLAGGTHHAYPGHGEGFCVLNDIAIAIRHWRAQRPRLRALIVDLDVHQGNANAVIFANDPATYTLSVHGAQNYPYQKETSNQDVPLPPGTPDEVYLSLLRDLLPEIIERSAPDVVYYQSGVDVLATDQLGSLSLSRAGCRERDLLVLRTCQERHLPVVVTMGGGYSQRLADTVEAHANTFRVARSLFPD